MNSFEIVAMDGDANLSVEGSNEFVSGKVFFIKRGRGTSLDIFILEWKPTNNNPVEDVISTFLENEKPEPLVPPPQYDEIKFDENGVPCPLMTQDQYQELKKREAEKAKASETQNATISLSDSLKKDEPTIPIESTNTNTAEAAAAAEQRKKYCKKGISIKFSDISFINVIKKEVANVITIKLVSGEVLPPFTFYSTKGLSDILQVIKNHMNVNVEGNVYTFSEIADKLNHSIFVAMNCKSEFKLKQSSDLIDLGGGNNDDDDDDDDNVIDNGKQQQQPPPPPSSSQQQQQYSLMSNESMDEFVKIDNDNGGSMNPGIPDDQNDNRQATFGNTIVGALNKGFRFINKKFIEQKEAFQRQQEEAKHIRQMYQEQQQQLNLQQQQIAELKKPHKIIEISEENPLTGSIAYTEHDMLEFDYLRRCKDGTEIPPCREHDGAPMGVEDFISLFDGEGRLTPEGLKMLCSRGFYTGFDEDVQPESWKWMLGFYKFDSTADEREKLTRERRARYDVIKSFWTGMDEHQMKASKTFARELIQIDKDVVRTDRERMLFKDMDKVNMLRSILTSYLCYNPDLGYVQGMNDLCAILMDVMDCDEAMSFWAFKCLMDRVSSSFDRDQIGVKTRLFAISKILRIVDPEYFEYLEKVGASEMYFCYRWILVMFKREFQFNETKILWEPILSNYMTEKFELFIACAMVLYIKSDIVLNNLSFDQILHFVNMFGNEHLFPCNRIVTLAELIYRRFSAEVSSSDNKQDNDLMGYLLGNRESFVSAEELAEAFEQF